MLRPALIVILGLTVALPVALVLGVGCDPRLLAEVVAHPVLRTSLLNSLALATAVTLGALACTLPLAWLSWRVRFRGQGLAEALLLTPLILPPFVGALGIAQLAGRSGAINAIGVHLGLWTFADAPDWLGEHRPVLAWLVEVLGLYPMLYLTLANTFARLDPTLLEAARISGAGRWTVARRIVLPLVMPGIFAGAAVVFVWSFTELGTPLLLGIDRLAPVQVFAGLSELQSNRLPMALAVTMLAVAASVYAGGRLAAGRAITPPAVKDGASAARHLHGWSAVAAWLPFALLAGMASLPHLAVLLLAVAGDWHRTVLPAGTTLDHLRAALAHPQVVPSIVNSLTYAIGATLAAVALGLAVAWATVPRDGRRAGRLAGMVDGLAMIPLAVPGLIMAFGFLALALLLCWRFPALKPWLDPQLNPGPLLVLAYAVRRLPQVVRTVAAGLSQIPPSLEEAAAACGAGPAVRLRRIILPLLGGALAAAAILTFSASMLEVSDSLVLAQQRDAWPVAKVIYELVLLLGPGPAMACAFAAWAMAFLAACLAAAAVFLGKGPRELFRS